MTAQKQFTNWAKLAPEDRKTSELVDRLGSDFFRLLDGLTIARARKHILRYFADDTARLGAFPERKKPVSISTEIDAEGLFLPYDEISAIIETYKLSLFKPTTFVKEEFKSQYDTLSRGVSTFKQSDRENFLIGMMKTNFLKRLESSIRSFEYTMKRTIDRIDKLEDALQKFKDVAGATFEAVDEETVEDEQDDLFEETAEFSLGKKKTFQFAHMKVDEFLTALEAPREARHPAAGGRHRPAHRHGLHLRRPEPSGLRLFDQLRHPLESCPHHPALRTCRPHRFAQPRHPARQLLAHG